MYMITALPVNPPFTITPACSLNKIGTSVFRRKAFTEICESAPTGEISGFPGYQIRLGIGLPSRGKSTWRLYKSANMDNTRWDRKIPTSVVIIEVGCIFKKSLIFYTTLLHPSKAAKIVI